MPVLRIALSALLLVSAAARAETPAVAPLPDAAAIMAQVAANQDHAVAERAHYIYVQHAHVVSRKGSKVMCEETTEARVTPSADHSQAQLLKLEGRLLTKHGYTRYTAPPAKKGESTVASDHITLDASDDDTDLDLVENMRDDLVHDRSKDGIGAGLFPLTSKTQADYVYHLVGREHINGREVFHLTFAPKDKDDYGWKGDAYIDTTAYQPVVVRTAMARKLPFAVRAVLGTSLPGLGFTVVYAPQPGDVWFPVSFGTEFKLHVLFFFNRQILLDAVNREFEQTHVSSKIVAAAGDGVTPQ